jgi:hypothetical protein
MSIKTRLSAIETTLETSEELSRHFVVYIGDAEPEDLQPWDSVIYLPRKAASAEAWVQEMRERFGYQMEHGPDSNGL